MFCFFVIEYVYNLIRRRMQKKQIMLETMHDKDIGMEYWDVITPG